MVKLETQEQKWRREGRKEAALMLMNNIEAESLEDDKLVSWGENGCSGDYSGYWNDKAVLEFFDVDSSESFIERQAKSFSAAMVKAEDAYFYEQFLVRIIESYKEDLSTNGESHLDKAAYFLGLHPDQVQKVSSHD